MSSLNILQQKYAERINAWDKLTIAEKRARVKEWIRNPDILIGKPVELHNIPLTKLCGAENPYLDRNKKELSDERETKDVSRADSGHKPENAGARAVYTQITRRFGRFAPPTASNQRD